ncbi:hypothetical protein BXY66_3545 [Shimia isoporae]|uniref:6-phosphogluconolactonase (Cycloisomerase 2 family) n=1 Tax=Shimia isoporae TaxID=647720 RepID=A0A4R1N2Z8_9RHOB|nr:hypothetical protein [Shimia isoporae]TCK99841.1 hypothetical protein BXY66_3545 [Shimia isoporae]
MISFELAGVLAGGSLSVPSENLSILSDTQTGQPIVLHHGNGTATRLVTQNNSLAEADSLSLLSESRTTLGPDVSPHSLAQPVITHLEHTASASMSGSVSTFLNNIDHHNQSACLLGYRWDDTLLLYVAQPSTGGISVYSQDTQGGLNFVTETFSGDPMHGSGISCMARIKTPSGDFLFSGSTLSHCLAAYQIDASGIPQYIGSIGANDGSFPVQTITAMVPAQIEGTNYLVVAASDSSSLSVLEVANDGQLTVKDHALDSSLSRFAGVTEIDTITVNGHVFIFATGSDDGISVMSLLPGGRLLPLSTIADSGSSALQNISSLKAVLVGDEI